jgi:hypothetical protein
MSQAGYESPVREPKKPLLPPSRIALIALVIVALIVFFFQYQARSACEGTCKAVMNAMKEGESTKADFKKKDVNKHILGSPTRETQEGGERFTWKGVLWSYHMRLQYDRDGHVRKVEQQ